ncbi:MAG: hypothetical protein HQL32_05475 [Planctomycetes bacterium]|nr:hypothetical protein [Planctomycetota bacterium]
MRETAPLVTYDIPVTLGDKAIHQPHLENFFDSIKGKATLNSDGLHTFESEACIFAVNEAVKAKKVINFKPEDFKV